MRVCSLNPAHQRTHSIERYVREVYPRDAALNLVHSSAQSSAQSAQNSVGFVSFRSLRHNQLVARAEPTRNLSEISLETELWWAARVCLTCLQKLVEIQVSVLSR